MLYEARDGRTNLVGEWELGTEKDTTPTRTHRGARRVLRCLTQSSLDTKTTLIKLVPRLG